MRKSLLPLIIVLTAIVVLTAILVNTRPEMRLGEKQDGGGKKESAINLSRHRREYVPVPIKQREFVMDGQTTSRMLYQAYNELEKGKIAQAADKVKTILVFQPDNIEALSLLGKIYYLRHDYKSAELIFRRQANLNKKSASAYNNLGQVLLKQNKYSQAVTQFRTAQKLDPESGLIALNLSGAYSREGKNEESLKSFKKAFKLLGSKIIPVANHPALDNIRDEEQFKEILRKAYKQLPRKLPESQSIKTDENLKPKTQTVPLDKVLKPKPETVKPGKINNKK
jgi:Flp pilus assembly protein TadD